MDFAIWTPPSGLNMHGGVPFLVAGLSLEGIKCGAYEKKLGRTLTSGTVVAAGGEKRSGYV